MALNCKNMKKFFIYIVLLTPIILINSCSYRIATLSKIKQPVLPSLNVVWADVKYDTPPLRYFYESSTPSKTIDCQIDYSFDNDLYNFRVTSDNDTVFFSISKYYIGTNTDSVNVMINMSSEDSHIHVVSDCFWDDRGRFRGFITGGTRSGFCHISSAKPVHVAVFVIVDVWKKNEQKSIYDFLEEHRIDVIDSIIQSIPYPY